MEQFDTITLSNGTDTEIEFYVLDNPIVNQKQYIVLYEVNSTDGAVTIMGVEKTKFKTDNYFPVSNAEVEEVFKVFEKNHPEFF